MSDAPHSAAPASPHPQASPEGIRETLDSIVVALILAFVFRAFIIEAFVIPTGSMAATLNGAHGTMICQNCGWEFTYGLTDPSIRGRAGYGITDKSVVLCRNCRFPNYPVETNDARQNEEGGDRILVLKWPFDIGGPVLGAQRWNVVVFKDPSDGVTNYIKRLAGMPDEVLEIVDGDVYSVPVAEVSPESRETLDAMRHVRYLRRTGASPAACDRREQELKEDYRAVLAELDQKLHIRRKTPQAQEDLWRTVYDHDYPPHKRGPEQPYWRTDPRAEAWMVQTRSLRFAGTDAAEQAVRLVARFDSFCAYNAAPTTNEESRLLSELVPVSDLRVRFVAAVFGGDGFLRVQLAKRDDLFTGELHMNGTVRLLHAAAGAPGKLKNIAETHIAPLQRGQMVQICFSNLDYRVSLVIDGKELLATSDDNYAPDVGALRRSGIPPTAPPTISAERLDVELTHVVTECDVYYLSELPRVVLVIPGLRPLGTQGNPVLLRADEYFMLGDNSAQSKDSRLWDAVGPHLQERGERYQMGTVPTDQLIGRAFFVYWPSGLRTTLIPFLRDRGWIPNFGRMRWIR